MKYVVLTNVRTSARLKYNKINKKRVWRMAILRDVTNASAGQSRVDLVGRDWLQQLCLVTIDDCKNTQETFILLYFIPFHACFISAGPLQ